MIKQNDNNCLPIIQRIGCFVRACGFMAELKTKKELTAKQINELWLWGKKSGNINYKDNVKHSAPIATKALKFLDDESGRFIEIGTFTKGKLNYYKWVTDNQKNQEKFFIQKIKTNGEIGTHFRNVDIEGKLLFDPFFPEVKVQDIFYSIIYIYEA